MQPLRVSFGIITTGIAECRDFYVRHFGFEVASEPGWYVHLRLPNGRCDLGLLLPGRDELHEVFHAPLVGGGVYLGIEVANVDQSLAELRAAGVSIAAELRDEPWGERHFVVRDPAGCLVNVWQRVTAGDS
jgi:catechol 2,3-dioxygenase-like lactoylglutathione lyase family enzyme